MGVSTLPLLSNSFTRMSLITQQILLQAQSERDDVLRRISLGDDTKAVKNLLTGITKRIAGLQTQMETERSKAIELKKIAQAKQEKANEETKGGPRRFPPRGPRTERPPLPEDLEIPCSDCTNVFTFTGKDQIFFQKQGWEQPCRCSDCKANRQAAFEAKKKMKPTGKSIVCEGCKCEIFFSDAKAHLFQEKGWAEPKRCSQCKANRQAAYEAKKAATGEPAPAETTEA